MPKRTPEQNEAISKKIKILKGEGLRQDRAIAAAMRMFKEGKLKIPKRASSRGKPQSSVKAISVIKAGAKAASAAKAASMRRTKRSKRRK